MSALSETLGNAKGVPPHQIEANGKVYTARLWDDGLAVGYERRLYDKAVEVERQNFEKGIFDRKMFNHRLDRITDRYAAGQYSFTGEVGEGVMKTRAGMLVILSLILGVPEMEVVRIIVARPSETTALFKLVLKESIPGIKFGKAKKDRKKGKKTEADAIADVTEDAHPNSAGPGST